MSSDGGDRRLHRRARAAGSRRRRRPPSGAASRGWWPGSPLRSAAPASWHTASAWSRRQWPSSSSSTCSAASTDDVDRAVGAGERVVGGHGEHEVLGEQQLLVRAGRRAPGRARTPTSSWPSRSRCEHDLGLLLDEQQLEVGEAVVQAGARRGGAGTARAWGTGPMRTLPDSGSWAWRAMLADVVGLAEDDPGPLDDPLAGVGEHDVAGAALDQLDAELASRAS